MGYRAQTLECFLSGSHSLCEATVETAVGAAAGETEPQFTFSFLQFLLFRH